MKKRISLIAAILLSCALCVGVTFALLSSASRPVVNTFTSGSVSITLSESTGTDYKMIPGVTHQKDPAVTVHKGSEACWLFVRVEKSSGFDDYMSCSIADGWTKLDSADGVYWISVPSLSSDRVYPVLSGNKVTVKDTVTEEKLAALSQPPSITFYAYAIQSEGVNTPSDAWQNILTAKEDEA